MLGRLLNQPMREFVEVSPAPFPLDTTALLLIPRLLSISLTIAETEVPYYD